MKYIGKDMVFEFKPDSTYIEFKKFVDKHATFLPYEIKEIFDKYKDTDNVFVASASMHKDYKSINKPAIVIISRKEFEETITLL